MLLFFDGIKEAALPGVLKNHPSEECTRSSAPYALTPESSCVDAVKSSQAVSQVNVEFHSSVLRNVAL
jgi:hypothetical protein